MIQDAWQDQRLGARGRVVLVHYDHAARASVPLTGELRDALAAHLVNDEEVHA